jgi:hypothetical protein
MNGIAMEGATGEGTPVMIVAYRNHPHPRRTNGEGTEKPTQAGGTVGLSLRMTGLIQTQNPPKDGKPWGRETSACVRALEGSAAAPDNPSAGAQSAWPPQTLLGHRQLQATSRRPTRTRKRTKRKTENRATG